MNYGEVLYSEAIDIWGLGILFEELLLGRRLFRTLTDSCEESNVPNKEFKKFLYDSHPNSWCPPTFKTTFKNIKEDFIDLLECMLQWDPRDRYSVEELFFHPCFKNLSRCHVIKPTEMIELIDQEFLTQENDNF
ncbi:hypothetical protein ACTFIV_010387 [Dictyostelium citrinum]